LIARATSNSGRIGTSESVTVTVDNVVPGVISLEPSNGAERVVSWSTLGISFTEEMKPASLEIVIIPDCGWLTYVWNPGNTSVTIAHEIIYSLGVEYTVTISGFDLAGNPIVTPIDWWFSSGVVEFIFPIIFR
jgi:hypothetical protein